MYTINKEVQYSNNTNNSYVADAPIHSFRKGLNCQLVIHFVFESESTQNSKKQTTPRLKTFSDSILVIVVQVVAMQRSSKLKKLDLKI